jgi:DNA mismatch endonuclease (patch repair protein)
MADTFTPEVRSACMSRIRSTGNRTTELKFIAVLRAAKITGWRRGSKLFGKPDFVFPFVRVAVFIDGDFWHGNPKKRRLPKSNIEYWTRKIESNKKRDRLVSRTLRRRGWRVLRIWESDLRNTDAVCCRIRRFLWGHSARLGNVELISNKSSRAPSSSI